MVRLDVERQGCIEYLTVFIADMPSTPSTYRQRLGEGNAGLSAVPGLVAGTPGGLRGEGRVPQPLIEVQQNQRPSVDSFSRVGLSSHLKTGQEREMAATGFVPTLRPRGKLLITGHLSERAH